MLQYVIWPAFHLCVVVWLFYLHCTPEGTRPKARFLSQKIDLYYGATCFAWVGLAAVIAWGFQAPLGFFFTVTIIVFLALASWLQTPPRLLGLTILGICLGFCLTFEWEILEHPINPAGPSAHEIYLAKYMAAKKAAQDAARLDYEKDLGRVTEYVPHGVVDTIENSRPLMAPPAVEDLTVLNISYEGAYDLPNAIEMSAVDDVPNQSPAHSQMSLLHQLMSVRFINTAGAGVGRMWELPEEYWSRPPSFYEPFPDGKTPAENFQQIVKQANSSDINYSYAYDPPRDEVDAHLRSKRDFSGSIKLNRGQNGL